MTTALDATRQKVLALETTMRALPQIDIPVRHYFCTGLYIREMTMPAGATVVGKIHRTAHLCVLSKGEVSVVTERGVRRLKAPYILSSPPGAKRALFAHEDAVWANLHVTDETDLDKLEAQLIAPSFEALEGGASWHGLQLR